MSHSNSRAYLNIDCSLSQANCIEAALRYFDNCVEMWDAVPTMAEFNADAEPDDLPHWAKQLLIDLAGEKMSAGEQLLDFGCEKLDIYEKPCAQNPDAFDNITLAGGHVDNDIFIAAHLILKAIDSDQMITTGIARICSEPRPDIYHGNLVAIGKHSWSYVASYEDVDALELETSKNKAYWLTTYGVGETPHKNTLIVISTAAMTKDDVAVHIINQLTGYDSVLPEKMETGDLRLKSINGKAYQQVKELFYTHQLV